MNLSGFDRGEATLSVCSSGGFPVLASEAIGIHLPRGMLDWSAGLSARMSVGIRVSFPGLTVMRADPVPLGAGRRRGWYDPGLVRDIARGSDDPSVSGLKVEAASHCAPARTIGRGRPLSRLRSLVLSRAPTVTLTFSSPPWGELLNRLAPGTPARLTLLDILDIGAQGGGYGVARVDRGGSGGPPGAATVTFAPLGPDDGAASALRAAIVLGGVPEYPR
jgi:hypothetical protein